MIPISLAAKVDVCVSRKGSKLYRVPLPSCMQWKARLAVVLLMSSAKPWRLRGSWPDAEPGLTLGSEGLHGLDFCSVRE